MFLLGWCALWHAAFAASRSRYSHVLTDVRDADGEYIGTKAAYSPVTLPWQAKVFEKVLGLDKSNNDKGDLVKDFQRQSNWQSLLISSFDVIKRFSAPLVLWAKRHKALFAFGCKASIYSMFGLLILRKISNWYKGMAEFELLLDHTDYEYQTYGFILNDVSGSIISSINQSVVHEYKYSYLYRKLIDAMDTPCFPQMMSDYSIQTGREVAVLINELDMRIRGRRKFGMSIDGHPFSSSMIKPHDESLSNSTYFSLDERLVLYTLQRGVSLLLARQADACLRLARIQVLTAVNTCEDLITLWKSRVASKSQTLRLPLPKFIISLFSQGTRMIHKRGLHQAITRMSNHPPPSDAWIPREVSRTKHNYTYINETETPSAFTNDDSQIDFMLAGSDGSIGDIVKDLNAREKLILLEEMQRGLYETAGQIQKHLDSLNGIRDLLLENDQINTPNYELAWNSLDEWVAQASVMCSNSLSLILIQSKSDTSKKDRMRSMQSHANSYNSFSSANNSSESVDSKIKSRSHYMKVRAGFSTLNLEMKDHHNAGVNHHNIMPYACSNETLVFLCNMAMSNDSAGYQGGGSIKLKEFVLPVEIGEVIEKSMVRSDGFALAVESSGDEVIASRPWESLQLPYIGKYGNDNLWARELNYAHHHTHSWLTKSTHHTLVQLLNTNDLRQDASGNRFGSAVLVSFMNLSDISWCKGCSYSTRWVFETVPFYSEDLNDVNSYNLTSKYVTKVSVTLDVKGPPSMYYSFISNRITSELKLFVEHWKRNALNILVDGARFYERQKQLPLGELDLLESIGRNTSEVQNIYDRSLRTAEDSMRPTKVDSGYVEVDLSSSSSRGNSYHKATDYVGKSIDNRVYIENSYTGRDTDVSDVVPQSLAAGINKLRGQWRLSELVLRDISKAPDKFTLHLEDIGLKKKSRRGLLRTLRLRFMLRTVFWSSAFGLGVEAAKRSNDIGSSVDVVFKNVMDFVNRRITTPALSIVEDVIFNRRVSLTDKEALKDAKRSLQAMLNDFLTQHRPKLTETERKNFVSKMDMTPISQEYELELRRPIQNLLSGRIARLVLIQLQFVKKELLVAMQAIDELFNANQVNLQLLAVTPAILSVFLLHSFSKTLLAAVKSSSRGRFIESSTSVQRDLRLGIRECERLFSMSSGFRHGNGELTAEEMGKLFSILFRLHHILVLNSSHFDDLSLSHLQEDMRDIAKYGLTVNQRLAMIERVTRSYPFLQATRKLLVFS